MSRGAWASDSVFGESCVAIALSGVTPDWATLATHAQLCTLDPKTHPAETGLQAVWRVGGGRGLYSGVGGLVFLLLSRVGGLDFLLLLTSVVEFFLH